VLIELFALLIYRSTVHTHDFNRLSALADSCGDGSVFVGVSFGMDQLNGRDPGSSVQQQSGASSLQRVLFLFFSSSIF